MLAATVPGARPREEQRDDDSDREALVDRSLRRDVIRPESRLLWRQRQLRQVECVGRCVLAPGQNQEVQALITPAPKAIAGDYVTSVRATSRGESASSNFRITVTTSTMWGIAGIGIIGVALLVMVGAVARFGRR